MYFLAYGLHHPLVVRNAIRLCSSTSGLDGQLETEIAPFFHLHQVTHHEKGAIILVHDKKPSLATV